ncbi:MAG: hypothetical protein ACKVZH_06340 [Blastocatellia bacterium]
MDIISGIKSEVIQPLATLVVPGCVAVGPYILVAKHHIPKIVEFWEKYPSAFTVIVLVIVIALGMLLEDIGTYIESRFWDKRLSKRDPDHDDSWDKYLKLKTKDEYVGQRYLRTILVRMKFELAMVPSTILCCLGLSWVNKIYHVWHWFGGYLFITVVLLAIAGYLFYESRNSAEVLAKTRKKLIQAIQEEKAQTKL